MACSKSREECTAITLLFIVPQFARDSKKFRYYISPLRTYFDCSCISCWWFTYHFTKSVTVVLIEGVWGHIKSWIVKLYSKVKCTLVQALRLCTGRTAHRESRGIALPFLGHSTRRGWGVSVTPRPLHPQERPGTHCTGGWVGPRAGLDRCGNSRSHRDSIPGTSNP